MQTETKSKALHSVFIDTESKTYLFDGKPMQGMLGLDLHIEPDNNYVTVATPSAIEEMVFNAKLPIDSQPLFIIFHDLGLRTVSRN